MLIDKEHTEKDSWSSWKKKNQVVEQQINQNVEQQRQYSTNIHVEPTVGDAQHVMVTERHDADMVQFQSFPVTNMVRVTIVPIPNIVQFQAVSILDLVSLEFLVK